MKQLAKIIGGSRLYGLETEDSDIDDPIYIYGLRKQDHHVSKEGGAEDFAYYEIRHFFNLLEKGNTQALEMLWAPEYSFLELDNNFKNWVLHRKYSFLDSERIFNSLMGYIEGERRRANGQNTGKLGSKRQESIKKFGYSPKNFVQLLRLAHCGITFFRIAWFPVNLQIELDSAQLLAAHEDFLDDLD